MKKENVFVRITSKEQAEQAKSILEGLGEKISITFMTNCSPNYDTDIYFGLNGWSLGVTKNACTELSLKQLIELILKEEEIKPLLVSEDGVNLFEGDDYWVPQSKSLSNSMDYYPDPCKFTICSNNKSSKGVFSTKQAALDWIEKQKPKSIKLFFCEVKKDQIIFNEPSGFITALELAMINDAVNKLS